MISTQNKLFIGILYIFSAIISLAALFMIVAAANVGFTLMYPPDSIDTPKNQIMSLWYLPFLLLALAGGMAWLCVLIFRKIRRVKDGGKPIEHYQPSMADQWKIVAISAVFLAAIYLIHNI